MEARVLIIGSGIAGSISALRLAEMGVPVTIIHPSPALKDTSSYHAQGGIIYRGQHDTPGSLIKDIWNAGDGIGDLNMIRLAAQKGPEAVKKILLEKLNIPFDRNADGCLALVKEGGHGCPRIIHARDATGRIIMEKINQALKEQPLISNLSGYTAIELLTSGEDAERGAVKKGVKNNSARQCHGAWVINDRGDVEPIISGFTVMATGGAGKLFKRSSNPSGARGHGVAMAYRAGAQIMDMEYIQFHPTALALPHSEPFLISEAVRGAGAKLVDSYNRPFMENYSPGWKDLAPRDIVARAIYQEMHKKNPTRVFLNFYDYLPSDSITDSFPTIYSHCKTLGIDIAKEPLPVAPAAHFSCGGIAVDQWGVTSLPGLFAIGECSRTGIHGGNRLASTSLLEGVIWADRAAQKIFQNLQNDSKSPPLSFAYADPKGCLLSEKIKMRVQFLEEKVQDIMWEKVGIIRKTPVLGEAVEQLKAISKEADRLFGSVRPAAATAGLRNMVCAALLAAGSAFRNRVSHGCHFVVS